MIQNSNIKLIALDVDGTLIKNDHTISERTKEAIAQATEQGVHVMLSTGRPPEMCHDIIEQLELNSYLITASGGEIWSADRTILERHIHDSELVESLWKIGMEKDLNMWIISTEEVFENGIYPEDFHAHEWLKIGFFSDDAEKLSEMKNILEAYDMIEITNSHPSNIEVNPQGVSKAHALIKVCNKLDITMDEVMAMGDSLNDFTMIDQAGVGVAMGNAQPEIKEIADFTTDSNNNDGVAKAIEKVVLSKKVSNI